MLGRGGEGAGAPAEHSLAATVQGLAPQRRCSARRRVSCAHAWRFNRSAARCLSHNNAASTMDAPRRSPIRRKTMRDHASKGWAMKQQRAHGGSKSSKIDLEQIKVQNAT